MDQPPSGKTMDDTGTERTRRIATKIERLITRSVRQGSTVPDFANLDSEAIGALPAAFARHGTLALSSPEPSARRRPVVRDDRDRGSGLAAAAGSAVNWIRPGRGDADGRATSGDSRMGMSGWTGALARRGDAIAAGPSPRGRWPCSWRRSTTTGWPGTRASPSSARSGSGSGSPGSPATTRAGGRAWSPTLSKLEPRPEYLGRAGPSAGVALEPRVAPVLLAVRPRGAERAPAVLRPARAGRLGGQPSRPAAAGVVPLRPGGAVRADASGWSTGSWPGTTAGPPG